MKTQSIIMAIALAASAAVAQDHGAKGVAHGPASAFRTEASSRVRLIAEAVPLSSAAGGPICLKLRLKNVSSAIAEYAENLPELDYNIVVFREDGAAVQRTAHGRELVEERWGRRISRSLAPGEEITDTVDITKIFDLTLKGKYFARVTHAISRVPQDAVFEVAVSNAVAFTITE
jgi:hypothetical protein